MAPPENVCLAYKYTVANKSVRMTNLQGALLLPQLGVMNERIAQHNLMYAYLVERTLSHVKRTCGPVSCRRLEFIPQEHTLVGPVYDSLQVRFRDGNGNCAGTEIPGFDAFLKMMQNRSHSIAKFSDFSNARNFRSWQSLDHKIVEPNALPQTTLHLMNVCDMRLLCHDTEKEREAMAIDFAECFQACF